MWGQRGRLSAATKRKTTKCKATKCKATKCGDKVWRPGVSPPPPITSPLHQCNISIVPLGHWICPVSPATTLSSICRFTAGGGLKTAGARSAPRGVIVPGGLYKYRAFCTHTPRLSPHLLHSSIIRQSRMINASETEADRPLFLKPYPARQGLSVFASLLRALPWSGVSCPFRALASYAPTFCRVHCSHQFG